MSYCTSESCYECSYSQPRNFFTKEEKIEMLKEYQKRLENEAKGVAEKIAEIESSINSNDEE